METVQFKIRLSYLELNEESVQKKIENWNFAQN